MAKLTKKDAFAQGYISIAKGKEVELVVSVIVADGYSHMEFSIFTLGSRHLARDSFDSLEDAIEAFNDYEQTKKDV